jgi:hypothetical protein
MKIQLEITDQYENAFEFKNQNVVTSLVQIKCKLRRAWCSVQSHGTLLKKRLQLAIATGKMVGFRVGVHV